MTTNPTEKHGDFKAALRLISQRVRRQTKELLKRAGARPKHWGKS